MAKTFEDFKEWWELSKEFSENEDVRYKIAFSLWKENVITPTAKTNFKVQGPTNSPVVKSGPVFNSNDDIPF